MKEGEVYNQTGQDIWCYCCKVKNHQVVNCPKKDKILQGEWAVNKSIQLFEEKNEKTDEKENKSEKEEKMVKFVGQKAKQEWQGWPR